MTLVTYANALPNMKQSRAILLDYLTCTDPVMITKWENILASYWHKDDGRIITNITETNGNWVFTTIDADGTETDTTITQYVEPANFPIAKINGLETALQGKVSVEVGKGLSTQDFTTALKTKLDSLSNYVKPNSEEIGYINGLQDALNVLQENINTVSDSIGQGNPVIVYWKGYRLFKEQGNVELYPQAGEEVKGRGDGTFFGGEIVWMTAKADVPDPVTAANDDFNLIESIP